MMFVGGVMALALVATIEVTADGIKLRKVLGVVEGKVVTMTGLW